MAKGKSLSKDIVLQKALDLARAESIEAVTYNRLARELDIRPQSMYRYVSNLKELQVFLINTFLNELTETIKNCITGLSPVETLRVYALKFYDEYHENSLYHEAFELMHRYELTPELLEPLSFFTGVIQTQMDQLTKDTKTAARYTQLFMAINIGYTHMVISDFFASHTQDERKVFEISINEFIETMILHTD